MLLACARPDVVGQDAQGRPGMLGGKPGSPELLQQLENGEQRQAGAGGEQQVVEMKWAEPQQHFCRQRIGKTDEADKGEDEVTR